MSTTQGKPQTIPALGLHSSHEASRAEHEALAWVPKDLLIGGRWTSGADGRRIEVEDPATGSPLCTVADGADADADAALAAAAGAQAAWAAAAPRERARVLRRAADALREHGRLVALLVTLEMGKPLAESRLRKLTFTGSEQVGRRLLGLAAARALPASVELGGCAPFIVFADADLDAAVEAAVAAKMRNGGAACTAANRFYVEHPVYEE